MSDMNPPVPFDERAIATLVDRFYEKVRVDAQLGPVFNAAVHDWDEHKALLTSFWASVALRASSYRGRVANDCGSSIGGRQARPWHR